GIGAAHHFHSRNPEPDHERHAADDLTNPAISWPNYHSGRNGDFQRIVPVHPVHELLRGENPSDLIEFFPAHPHEGAVGVPPERGARSVAQGTSLTTGRRFNLVVAFERVRDQEGNLLGRGVAHSSFHHFADYNWDTGRGAPSFVTEPEGQGMKSERRALQDIRRYVRNLAVWLAPPAGPSAAPPTVRLPGAPFRGPVAFGSGLLQSRGADWNRRHRDFQFSSYMSLGDRRVSLSARTSGRIRRP